MNAADFAAAMSAIQEEYAAIVAEGAAAVEDAFAQKEADIAALYDQISEKISNLYDKHLQKKLQKALDWAREQAAEACAESLDNALQRAAALAEEWDSQIASETARNGEADQKNSDACKAAADEQGANFSDFIDETSADFAGFQSDESETFWLNIEHTDSKFNEGKNAYYVKHISHKKTVSRKSHYGSRYTKESRYVEHKPFFFTDKDIDFELQPLIDSMDDKLNAFEGEVKGQKADHIAAAQAEAGELEDAINADSDAAEDTLQSLADAYLQETADEFNARLDDLISSREGTMADLEALAETKKEKILKL